MLLHYRVREEENWWDGSSVSDSQPHKIFSEMAEDKWHFQTNNSLVHLWIVGNGSANIRTHYTNWISRQKNCMWFIVLHATTNHCFCYGHVRDIVFIQWTNRIYIYLPQVDLTTQWRIWGWGFSGSRIMTPPLEEKKGLEVINDLLCRYKEY